MSYPHDEFDALLRDTLDHAADATPIDPQLSERLIANARTQRRVAVPLHRRSGRFYLPLLAAAAVLVAVGTTAAVTAVNADRDRQPATHPPSPSAPVVPMPSSPTTSPAPSTPSHRTTPPTHSTAATHVPVPADFAASDVDALSDSMIFAIGNARCASGSRTDCPALARSDDGGSTWTRLNLPSGLVSVDDAGCGDNGSASGPCVAFVDFVTPQLGYVWATRMLFATTDGGQHWTQDTSVVQLHSVVVHDGVAVRVSSVPCSSGCGGIEQTSVDGGPWVTTHSDHPDGGVGAGTDSLSATTDGFVLTSSNTLNQPPEIFTSTQGKVWTRRSATGLCTNAYLAVALDGTLFTTCPTSGGKRLFRSRDDGDTFSPVAAVPTDETNVVAALDSSTLLAATSYDDNTTIDLFRTTDAGGHWTKVTGAPAVGQFSLQSGSHWYDSVEDSTGPRTYYSNDRGQSWHLLHVS